MPCTTMIYHFIPPRVQISRLPASRDLLFGRPQRLMYVLHPPSLPSTHPSCIHKYSGRSRGYHHHHPRSANLYGGSRRRRSLARCAPYFHPVFSLARGRNRSAQFDFKGGGNFEVFFQLGDTVERKRGPNPSTPVPFLRRSPLIMGGPHGALKYYYNACTH